MRGVARLARVRGRGRRMGRRRGAPAAGVRRRRRRAARVRVVVVVAPTTVVVVCPVRVVGVAAAILVTNGSLLLNVENIDDSTMMVVVVVLGSCRPARTVDEVVDPGATVGLVAAAAVVVGASSPPPQPTSASRHEHQHEHCSGAPMHRRARRSIASHRVTLPSTELSRCHPQRVRRPARSCTRACVMVTLSVGDTPTVGVPMGARVRLSTLKSRPGAAASCSTRYRKSLTSKNVPSNCRLNGTVSYDPAETDASRASWS